MKDEESIAKADAVIFCTVATVAKAIKDAWRQGMRDAANIAAERGGRGWQDVAKKIKRAAK